jgi:hypothetical protein
MANPIDYQEGFYLSSTYLLGLVMPPWLAFCYALQKQFPKSMLFILTGPVVLFALVARSDHQLWSDFVEWAVQTDTKTGIGLFYGRPHWLRILVNWLSAAIVSCLFTRIVYKALHKLSEQLRGQESSGKLPAGASPAGLTPAVRQEMQQPQ